MPTIIDKAFDDNKQLVGFLAGHGETSLGQLAEDSFRRILVLSAASYFESQITDALHNYCVKRTDADACIVAMVKMKVLARQYHTFFDWDKKSAATFFRLLGDSIGSELKKESATGPLKNSVAAFLELGQLRNSLVHQNFASYTFEKTTKEVYELYESAVVFVNAVIRKLEQRSISSEELQNKIRERAYEIYLRRGMQDGHADDDWTQAEAEIVGSN